MPECRGCGVALAPDEEALGLCRTCDPGWDDDEEKPWLLCFMPVGHRNKHDCNCTCALARGHKGRHRCAVEVGAEANQ